MLHFAFAQQYIYMFKYSFLIILYIYYYFIHYYLCFLYMWMFECSLGLPYLNNFFIIIIITLQSHRYEWVKRLLDSYLITARHLANGIHDTL